MVRQETPQVVITGGQRISHSFTHFVERTQNFQGSGRVTEALNSPAPAKSPPCLLLFHGKDCVYPTEEESPFFWLFQPQPEGAGIFTEKVGTKKS